MELGKYAISIFLDLSKSFGTLEHKIIYDKLEKYGIWGACLNWFKSYLHQKEFMVKSKVAVIRNSIKSDK